MYQQVLNLTPLNPAPATCHKRKRKLRCSFRSAALQKLHCNIVFSAMRKSFGPKAALQQTKNCTATSKKLRCKKVALFCRFPAAFKSPRLGTHVSDLLNLKTEALLALLSSHGDEHLSCTRLRVPPVALHVSRYTCRSSFLLDFIAFCSCSSGVAPHPLKIWVSHLLPPPVPGGVAPKFGSEKVSRYTGVSQLQLLVSRYTVQLR